MKWAEIRLGDYTRCIRSSHDGQHATSPQPALRNKYIEGHKWNPPQRSRCGGSLVRTTSALSASRSTAHNLPPKMQAPIQSKTDFCHHRVEICRGKTQLRRNPQLIVLRLKQNTSLTHHATARCSWHNAEQRAPKTFPLTTNLLAAQANAKLKRLPGQACWKGRRN